MAVSVKHSVGFNFEACHWFRNADFVREKMAHKNPLIIFVELVFFQPLQDYFWMRSIQCISNNYKMGWNNYWVLIFQNEIKKVSLSDGWLWNQTGNEVTAAQGGDVIVVVCSAAQLLSRPHLPRHVFGDASLNERQLKAQHELGHSLHHRSYE